MGGPSRTEEGGPHQPTLTSKKTPTPMARKNSFLNQKSGKYAASLKTCTDDEEEISPSPPLEVGYEDPPRELHFSKRHQTDGYVDTNEKRRRLATIALGAPPIARSGSPCSSPPSVPADGVCTECGTEGDPSQLLVCDDCQDMTHTLCLQPPLARVPSGPWQCWTCRAQSPSSAATTRFKGASDVLDDKSGME